MELSDKEPGTHGYGQDEWIKLPHPRNQSGLERKPHVVLLLTGRGPRRQVPAGEKD